VYVPGVVITPVLNSDCSIPQSVPGLCEPVVLSTNLVTYLPCDIDAAWSFVASAESHTADGSRYIGNGACVDDFATRQSRRMLQVHPMDRTEKLQPTEHTDMTEAMDPTDATLNTDSSDAVDHSHLVYLYAGPTCSAYWGGAAGSILIWMCILPHIRT